MSPVAVSAVAGGPGSSAARAAAAHADYFFRSNAFAKARAAYALLSERRPEELTPRLRLVRVLLRLDEWDRAVQVAQDSTRRFPDSADLRGLYGLALLRAGNVQAATAQAKTAVSLDPKSYWGLVARAEIARWQGRKQEAVTGFRQAAKLRPREPDAWLGLVMAQDEQSADFAVAAGRYSALKPRGHPHEQWLTWVKGFVYAGGPAAATEGRKESAPQSTVNVLVPFEGSICYVTVRIDGVPFRLLFDTGGGGAILLSAAAARRLTSKGQAYPDQLSGVQGTEEVLAFVAKEVAIGSLALNDCLIHEIRTWAGAGDGMIGAGLFDDYRVTLDFEQRTLRISESGSSSSSGSGSGTGGGASASSSETSSYSSSLEQQPDTMTVPLHLIFSNPLIRLRIADKPVWALVDTGAGDYFISLRLARHLSQDVPDERKTFARNSRKLSIGETQSEYQTLWLQKDIAVNLLESTPAFTCTWKTIMGYSFVDRQISPSMNVEVGAVLGTTFLARFKSVTIDYPRRVMIFRGRYSTPL